MNTKVMQATTEGSLDGTLTFPEVVQMLMAEGVESYHVDLVRQEKTFYMPNGESYVEKMTLPTYALADGFSAEQVVASLRAIQNKEISYMEFLRLIMKAGTTHYIVFLVGRRALYFGRKGEFHVEEFPGVPVTN